MHTLHFHDAQLIFRNFAGLEKQFNNAGSRNFGVLLDNEHAKELKNQGWVVRYLTQKGTENKTAFLTVHLDTTQELPTIMTIQDGNEFILSVEHLESLDWLPIIKADLVVEGRSWAFNDKSGIRAYVQSLTVTTN